MKKLFVLLALLIARPALGQINCPNGFSTSGPCGASSNNGSQPFWLGGASGASILPGNVLLLPAGVTHTNADLLYLTQVNVQAFNATFSFVPNGQNVAFMFENSNNNPGFDMSSFVGGAGCEAGFFQGFAPPSNPPNNVFALELDSYSPLTNNGSFSYSSAQIYTSSPFVQCPCLPVSQCGNNNTPIAIDKISTSPVNLNFPPGTQNTTTGDVYNASLIYDGSNLTLNLQDLTITGPVFTNTWTGVDIPASVGGNMAWVGIVGATGISSSFPLTVNSLVFNPGTATSTPTASPTPSPSPSPTPSLSPSPRPTSTPNSCPTCNCPSATNTPRFHGTFIIE